MNNKWTKRIWSWIMIGCMLFTMIPAALAEDAAEPAPAEPQVVEEPAPAPVPEPAPEPAPAPVPAPEPEPAAPEGDTGTGEVPGGPQEPVTPEEPEGEPEGGESEAPEEPEENPDDVQPEAPVEPESEPTSDEPALDDVNSLLAEADIALPMPIASGNKVYDDNPNATVEWVASPDDSDNAKFDACSTHKYSSGPVVLDTVKKVQDAVGERVKIREHTDPVCKGLIDGRTIYVCNGCGGTCTIYTKAAHNWVADVDRAPYKKGTCGETWLYYTICSECGTKGDQLSSDPAEYTIEGPSKQTHDYQPAVIGTKSCVFDKWEANQCTLCGAIEPGTSKFTGKGTGHRWEQKQKQISSLGFTINYYHCKNSNCPGYVAELGPDGNDGAQNLPGFDDDGHAVKLLKHTNNTHNWGAATWYDATCEENGFWGFKCNICGVISTWDEIQNDPDAIAQGLAEPSTNQKPSGALINKLYHLYNPADWKPVEGTKGTDHQMTNVCIRCGKTATWNCSYASANTTTMKDCWVTPVQNPATCLTPATTTYECKLCGYKADEVGTDESLGEHHFDPNSPDNYWKVGAEPKCTAGGTQIQVCTVCKNATKEVAVPAQHNFELEEGASLLATCDAGGIEIYYCQNPNCPGKTSKDDSTITTETSNPAYLGKAKKTVTTSPLHHSWGYYDSKAKDGCVIAAGATPDQPPTPATCVAPSSEHYTCERCGKEATTHSNPLDPNAHQYTTEVTTIPENCQHARVQGYECTLCHKLARGSKPADGDPALNGKANRGHIFKLANALEKPDDCDEAWQRKYVCTDPNCPGAVAGLTGTTDASGVETTVTLVDASWIKTENGKATWTTTADKYWSNGKTVDGNKRAGHEWVKLKDNFVVEPTCLTNGYTATEQCKNCGAYNPDTHVVGATKPKLHHKWNAKWQDWEAVSKQSASSTLALHIHVKFCENPGCQFNIPATFGSFNSYQTPQTDSWYAVTGTNDDATENVANCVVFNADTSSEAALDYVHTPATCMTPAKSSWTCKVCGWTRTLEDAAGTLDPNNHIFPDLKDLTIENVDQYVEWTKAPTCAAPGIGRLKCTNPNCDGIDTKVQTFKNMLRHNWVEVKEAAVPPTCTTAGTKTFACENADCPTRKLTDDDPNATYAIDESTGKFTKTIVDPATHNWGQPTYIKDPKNPSINRWAMVCQNEGCPGAAADGSDGADGTTIDGKAYKLVTDPDNPTTQCKHEAVDAGIADGTLKPVEPTQNNFPLPTATCTSKGVSAFICPTCGTEVYAAYGDPLGHTWEREGFNADDKTEANGWIVDTAATCAAAGSGHWKCTDPACNAPFETSEPIEIPIDPANHVGDPVEVERLEPTCTTDGHEAGHNCSACGKPLDGENVIPALGHTWAREGFNADDKTEANGWVVDTLPTCIAVGSGHWKCTDTACDAPDDQSEPVEIPIDPTNHVGEPQDDPAKDPTCTQEGHTGGHICSACKRHLDEEANIPALGHTWARDGFDINDPANQTVENGFVVLGAGATCLTAGTGYFECTDPNCDAPDANTSNTVEIPALGHDFTGAPEQVTDSVTGETVTAIVCGNANCDGAAGDGSDGADGETQDGKAYKLPENIEAPKYSIEQGPNNTVTVTLTNPDTAQPLDPCYIYYIWLYSDTNGNAWNQRGPAQVVNGSAFVGVPGGRDLTLKGLEVYVVSEPPAGLPAELAEGEHYGYQYFPYGTN